MATGRHRTRQVCPSILFFVQPTPTRRVWVDVIDLFLIGRLLGDAEYRYVMGHVEAQMYSVMSSVLDYI